MSDWTSFFQRRLVPGETLVEIAENLKLSLGFVPLGEPMRNAAPAKAGRLALTSHRLMVQWRDTRLKVYSTLAIYALSERFFDPRASKWPYQAILILSGGMTLMVETVARDTQSAGQLSRFLTKALFSLGKQDTDIASVAAMNAHLEELRRREEERRRQDDDYR
ncbi:MAG: hypothetical protein ACE5GO_07885 [Anaerolineales bacterium]